MKLLLTRKFPFAQGVLRPRFLLPLVVLVGLVILVACGDDGEEATTIGTPPTAERTAAVGTGTPEGTPVATPTGELSISFTAECQGDDGAPELSVAVQATATDEAFIDRIRVFVDGSQRVDQEADSAKEFDETLSFPTTPGDHEVRVSVEGGGLQVVTLPQDAQEVTCPGTPEE